MKNSMPFLLAFFFLNDLNAQNYTRSNVLIQYDYKSHPNYKEKNKSMSIYFGSGFKDSLEVLIDNKVI